MRRTTGQALDLQERATSILPDPLADGVHLVEEGGEFVDGRITPGGRDPVIAYGSQALDAAPELPVINAATFERGIEPGDVSGLGTHGDSILRRDVCQVDF